jgi:hypothetical protein
MTVVRSLALAFGAVGLLSLSGCFQKGGVAPGGSATEAKIHKIYVATPDGVYRSLDSGATFTFFHDACVTTEAVKVAVYGSRVGITGTNGGVCGLDLDDPIVNYWIQCSASQNGFPSTPTVHGLYAAEGTLLVATSNGWAYSTNTHNWITTVYPIAGYENNMNAVAAHPPDYYIATQNTGLYILRPEVVPTVPPHSYMGNQGFPVTGRVYAVAVDRDYNSLIVGTNAGFSVASTAGVDYSINNYFLWTTTTASVNGFAASDSVNTVGIEDDLICAGTPEGISVSSDHGTSWRTTVQSQNGFAASKAIINCDVKDGIVYASTSLGISVSSDAGATWTTILSGERGLPVSSVNWMAVDQE